MPVFFEQELFHRCNDWSMVVAAALTRIANFPINDALMTCNAMTPPPNVRNLWAPWEKVHTVCATLSVAAHILQVLA